MAMASEEGVEGRRVWLRGGGRTRDALVDGDDVGGEGIDVLVVRAAAFAGEVGDTQADTEAAAERERGGHGVDDFTSESDTIRRHAHERVDSER